VVPLAGEALYAANCAACHGADLEGVIGPALAGNESHIDHHDGAELVLVIAAGQNEMPAFAETLTAEEIQAVVEYIQAADAD
jgi:mono/diheme cytochrome c family protein